MDRTIFILSLSLSSLFSLPTTPQTLNGEVSITHFPEGIEVVAADRTLLEWAEFSIHEDEFARFILPSSESTLLNRITGPGKSSIFGSLESNGKVVLINQAGIVFGKNCSVNVASLTASSIDVIDQSFIQHRELRFFGEERGSISIDGNINVATDFYAIGHSIEMDGMLRVNGGNVGFFALGNTRVDPKGLDGPFVGLTPRISLRTLQKELDQGKLLFSGSLEAPQSPLFGAASEILLGENAFLKGAEVFLGGLDRANVFASSLVLSPSSTIDVSANEHGNGGRAILWSRDATNFHGTIHALGGSQSGDGGFIEVSGLKDLNFQGWVFTDAPHGEAGNLLIDPTNVLIAAANNNIAPVPPAAPPYTFTGPAVSISAANLATVLAGTNVTINTSAANDQGQAGTITISNAVSWNSIRTLTLIADTDILVGATVENLGAGAVTLTAARDITLDAQTSVANIVVGARNGTVNVTAGRDLLVRGGPSGGGLGRFAAIGTGAVVANTGTINVVVGRNATLQGGTGAIAGAGNTGFALIGGFTTSTRTVNVTVANDLSITGGTGGLENNGAPFAIIGSYQGTNSGNINVKVGNNCSIQGGVAAAVNRVPCAGILRAGEGTTFPASISVTDFNIDVGNNLTIIGGTVFGAGASTGAIGWGGFQFLAGAVVTAANLGNITLNVGHNLELATGAGRGVASIVGGTQRPCQGNVIINVGEYMWLHHQNPAMGSSLTGCLIGGSGQRTQWLLNFYVTVGKTLTMDARNGAFLSFHCFNTGGNYINQGIVQFHIGGDLVFLGGNDAFTGDIAAVWLHPNLINEIWVGGNWRAYNGSPIGTDNYAGVEPNTFFAGGNIGRPDWRAGGNLIVAGALTPATASLFTTTQPITIIADAPFVLDQLWAPKTAIVNGINIFTGTPLGASSTNTSTVAPFHSGGDGLGGFFVDTSSYAISPVAFPTTIAGPSWSVSTPVPPVAGTPNVFVKFYAAAIVSPADMLIRSSDLFDNASPADFPIGTVSQTVHLQNNTGNITVEGFRDVNITNANSIFSILGDITIDVERDINGNGSTSTAGDTIQLIAGRNINLTTAAINAGVDLFQTAGDDINLLSSTETATLGSITSLAGNNSAFTNSSASSGINIDWVIDNDFPDRPLIGLGGFVMNASSFFSVGGGYIRVYTARQGQNNISPMGQFISNGIPFTFSLGTLFADTDQEQWCIYYPEGSLGVPFRIFYKDCLQLIAQQATVVIDQFLVDLHPYNEFPGWMASFRVINKINEVADPYFIRRRNLNVANQPKSWTVLLPE